MNLILPVSKCWNKVSDNNISSVKCLGFVTNGGPQVQYIEDITWPRGDTNFIFECRKNLTSERSERVRFLQHEKIKFVSPSGHVIFFLSYTLFLYFVSAAGKFHINHMWQIWKWCVLIGCFLYHHVWLICVADTLFISPLYYLNIELSIW